MKQDFLDYCKTTFFRESIEENVSQKIPYSAQELLPMSEFEAFEKSLSRPLKKTIRLNTNQINISEFIEKKTKDGWIFGKTNNPAVWHIDRIDTTTALGSTEEHMRGDFYIQELSASQTVWILSDGKIHPEAYMILEMASSPGGKTTQLAEHYPNSFIAANEFSKERINALLDNLERMRVENYGVSRLNGVQFRDYPEMFDRVLLDAPCSGEGIGYKAEESLKFWNIKNVQKIARLQEKMLIAGLIALKPGGELGYSTCTLNTIENEGVLEAAKREFGDAIEIIFQKRYWPHREVAGGFFVAKILKKHSFNTNVKQANTLGEISGKNTRYTQTDSGSGNKAEYDKMEQASYKQSGTHFRKGSSITKTVGNSEVKSLNESELRQAKSCLDKKYFTGEYQLYRYKDTIRAVRYSQNINHLIQSWYCIKLGVLIGRFEGGKLVSITSSFE